MATRTVEKACRYIDPNTSASYPADVPRWCSAEGAPLMLESKGGLTPADIERDNWTIWRYSAALPSHLLSPVSLGEGCTPIVERAWNGNHVLFKLDFISPTGSFKDKGASVVISHLRHLGVSEILEDSSGNGGAAMAAYGAAGNIKVHILAPSGTSETKISQMRRFGASVRLVSGSRDDCQTEAVRQSHKIFYASHNWHPFFLQGTKLTAYEIWEALNFRAPDNLIIPTGGGSNVLGSYIGFKELLAAGQIRALPRLIGVQPRNCCPITASFEANETGPVPVRISPTIAEGASIANPVRRAEVLSAVRHTGGRMVAVNEADIMPALDYLARTGIFVEPTSAIAAAALDSLYSAGAIRPSELTVVLLTGSGLKMAANLSSS